MDLHQHAPADDPGPERTPRPVAQTGPAALRASDAERDRVADILRDALAEGRLAADEHAERVEGALSAKTTGELEAFVRDLPGAHHRREEPARHPAPSRPTAGAIPVDPDDSVVAVFGAAARRGSRRAGRRIHAWSVFGSVEIDLSEALFDHQQVVVKAMSVFGDIQIRVPENVSLRGMGGGVLGNFEVDNVDSRDAQAPVVYIDGWAVLGNIEARPRRGRTVADILLRAQRPGEKEAREQV